MSSQLVVAYASTRPQLLDHWFVVNHGLCNNCFPKKMKRFSYGSLGVAHHPNATIGWFIPLGLFLNLLWVVFSSLCAFATLFHGGMVDWTEIIQRLLLWLISNLMENYGGIPPTPWAQQGRPWPVRPGGDHPRQRGAEVTTKVRTPSTRSLGRLRQLGVSMVVDHGWRMTQGCCGWGTKVPWLVMGMNGWMVDDLDIG